MKKIFYLIIPFIGLSKFGIAQEYLPTSEGEVIKHTYYTLSYLENFEQAEWVYYLLTPDMLKGNANRVDRFRPDSKVVSGSAQLADYKGSGYDRGHLVPAGDMKTNDIAMSESFYMSNISPQSPSFNRGVWKSLETLIRSWASKNTLHIVTGGVLKDGLEEIGGNGVDVPTYFYKVVYAPNDNEMIAFVLPNEKSKKNLSEYITCVDIVEQLTGIDFFPQLPDEFEEDLENKVSFFHWDF